MIPDFTIVLGVDRAHLEQLRLVWPNWMERKPSLGYHNFLIFYDSEVGSDWEELVLEVAEITAYRPPNFTGDSRTSIRAWPPEDVKYVGDPTSRFGNPQRYKMLSGFCHMPARLVQTPYWLKLDLDTIALGNDDWIDPNWFAGDPAIIAHPWNYTKPKDQMIRMDDWMAKNASSPFIKKLQYKAPLNIRPENEQSTLVSHKRIISWCGFFRTDFTVDCSKAAEALCGEGQLPVMSQDGFLWYCARQAEQGIVRADMKRAGWDHLSRTSQLAAKIEELKAQSNGKELPTP